MAKIAVIENCAECPHHVATDDELQQWMCNLDSRYVPIIKGIPYWCPLEDYGDKEG